MNTRISITNNGAYSTQVSVNSKLVIKTSSRPAYSMINNMDPQMPSTSYMDFQLLETESFHPRSFRIEQSPVVGHLKNQLESLKANKSRANLIRIKDYTRDGLNEAEIAGIVGLIALNE